MLRGDAKDKSKPALGGARRGEKASKKRVKTSFTDTIRGKRGIS